MKYTKKLIVDAYSALAIDLSLPDKDINTIKHRAEHEGLKFLTTALPVLEKALLSGLESGLFLCPTTFSRCSRGYPKLLGSFFRKIFDCKGKLLEKPCPYAVKVIRQVCSYAYKSDLPNSADLDSRVINGFIQTEDELKDLNLVPDPITETAASIISSLFRGLNLLDISPRHGPGGIAESIGALSKNSAIAKAKGSFNFNSMYGHLLKSPFSDGSTDGSLSFSTHDYFARSNEAPSKVVLVPKDSRGPRLICAEPLEKMYIQQGVRSQIERVLESHPLTCGHVNFTDSSVNRMLAEIGSLPTVSAGWATIDLKDASDRVSVGLVSLLFSRVPHLLDALLVLRPKAFLLPDGRILPSVKHAPMGSALCFPILATSIWSLLVTAFVGLGLSLEEACRVVYVYGDDIVVPKDLAIYSMNILERYGLKVNNSKSFVQGNFKESCGADFFLGVSNTPVRLKKIWWLKHIYKDVPHRYECFEYVKHAQSCETHGLPMLAQYWYALAEKGLGRLPYGTEITPHLCRFVDPDLVASYNMELFDRLGIDSDVLTTSCSEEVIGYRFPLYFVTPVKEKKTEFSRGHLLRLWPAIGTPDNHVDYGTYEKHNDFNIVKRNSYLSRQGSRIN